MDKIGETIRYLLKKRYMSSMDLARATQLSQSTIDNIIHGKSRKEAFLQRISSALGLDLINFNKENTNKNIDKNLYKKALSTVENVLESENIEANKRIIDALSELTYKYLTEDSKITDKDLVLFVKGMVRFGLDCFILNHRIQEKHKIEESSNNFFLNGIKISPREAVCLYYLTRGLKTQEIARILNLSNRTVETHISSLKLKLKFTNYSKIIELDSPNLEHLERYLKKVGAIEQNN